MADQSVLIFYWPDVNSEGGDGDSGKAKLWCGILDWLLNYSGFRVQCLKRLPAMIGLMKFSFLKMYSAEGYMDA